MPAPHIVSLPYNWSTDRDGNAVVAIVAHNTVGVDSRKYLSRGGELPDGSDRKVSIHSLIRKDGVLYRYVPDERGANHAGFGKVFGSNINPNKVTIGFELENASNGKGRVDLYTKLQLLVMGWEINRIRAKYGVIPILRHGDIDPTRRADPVGLSVAQMEDWAVKAAAHFGEDPWLAWGTAYALPVEQRHWGIPTAWLAQSKVLGRAETDEIYHTVSVSSRLFEHGMVIYHKPTNRTHVVLF